MNDEFFFTEDELFELKKGDKFAVYISTLLHEPHYVVREVKKVTRTQILDTEGNRYSRETGSLRGSQHNQRMLRINKYISDSIEERRTRAHRAKIRNYIYALVKDADMETLNQVLDIFKKRK